METRGPGGDGAEADELKLQDSIDAALNNYEIVKSICSATSSVKDILNFRLVNTTFHYEATVRMRTVPAPIELLSDEAMAKFLTYLRADRMDLVSPFTAFKLDLQLQDGSNVMEEFSTAVGSNARHYIFDRRCYNNDTSLNKRQEAHMMAVLLSRSPQVYSHHLWSDHFLTAEDLELVPFLSELQILKIRYFGRPEDQLLGTTSLLSTLVSQPSPLKHVVIPSQSSRINASEGRFDEYVDLPNMDILRLIVQHHKRLPTVSMDEFNYNTPLNLRSETLDVFQELIGMNLILQNLGIALECPYWIDADEPLPNDGKKILNTVTDLLNQQSTSLTRLNFHQIISPGTITLSLPRFPNLTELTLTTYQSKLLLLKPNQFPVLRRFRFLTNHEGYFETIAQTRLPSVQEVFLSLNNSARFTGSLKVILPNVTKLTLDLASPEELAVILTQFSEIVDLCVGLGHLERNGNNSNYWNTWTGGSPRLLDAKTLLDTEIKIQNLELVEPVQENDGSYRVPSLRNMKGLKKLNCRFHRRDEVEAKENVLDPILYMTLANSLVPLEELTIQLDSEKTDEMTEYENILSKFHTNVKIVGPRIYSFEAEEEEEEQDDDALSNEASDDEEWSEADDDQ